MANDQSILIPGGLRLRTVRTLTDRDGSCPLLYDLERSRLVDVPAEFQLHLAMALETGDLDEDLLAWLASEDLLTYERQAAWSMGDGWSEAARLEPAAEPAEFGEVYFVRDRVHCRIDLDREDDALATLGALLGEPDGAPRLTLELAGTTAVAGAGALRRIVDEAERRGRLTAREIQYDVTVAAEAVDVRLARFLAEHPFRVRVWRPEAPASEREWRRGLGVLLRHLGERVTVCAALGAGDRLADLWEWAKGIGAPRVDATKDDGPARLQADLHGAEVRRFRHDLFDICDEMFVALELGRVPPLYEPVARGVRRLTAGRPVTPAHGAEGSCIGRVSNGQVLPLCAGAVAAPEAFAAAWDETDATICGPLCSGCGGRDCGAGSGRDAGRRSAFQRAEVEAAILFYGRLRQADSALLLGFPTEGPDVGFDSLPVPRPVELKTC